MDNTKTQCNYLAEIVAKRSFQNDLRGSTKQVRGARDISKTSAPTKNIGGESLRGKLRKNLRGTFRVRKNNFSAESSGNLRAKTLAEALSETIGKNFAKLSAKLLAKLAGIGFSEDPRARRRLSEEKKSSEALRGGSL